ncbi:MAG: MFS transporter [Dehalococcoidia bacterium]|nr:MFS transporter [Dehalococcoidia bacterium]
MLRPRTFESLHIRDFRLLWFGQVSTSMGQWMDQVTRGYLIYTMTGSALDTGAVTAARGLPLLLFGIVAGALADRSGRKIQLLVAQITNAILNLILATLVLTGQVEPWHVYASAFLAGTVQAFQQPARQTLISDIVGNDKLLNALALNSAALNGSRALGPAIAGAFIAFASVAGSYYLQAAMYAFATIWTIQMVVPEVHTGGASGRVREPFFKSITEGLKYVSTQPSTRTQLLLALGPLTFAMSYSAMIPVIALDVLGGDSQTQGFLLTSIGLGALAGALVVASLRRSYAYGLPVVLGACAFSAAVFIFASSHWLWLSCALGVVVGVFSVTYTTQDQTLLQVSTPAFIRGRDEHLPAQPRHGAPRRTRRRSAGGPLRGRDRAAHHRGDRPRDRRAGGPELPADPEAEGAPPARHANRRGADAGPRTRRQRRRVGR